MEPNKKKAHFTAVLFFLVEDGKEVVVITVWWKVIYMFKYMFVLFLSPTNFLQEKTSHIITIMIRRKRENDEKEHVIIMCMISREPYVHKNIQTFHYI